MDYNAIVNVLILLQIVVCSVALIVILPLIVGDIKRYVRYRKRKKYGKMWNYKFIKQKPILTFRIKRLIHFIRRFGIKVKVAGINLFMLEINGSYYSPRNNTIVLHPNCILATNQEASVLCTLAHEFGHAFAVLIGKEYPRNRRTDRSIVANPNGIIKDEQQAWHFAHICLQKLFPNDRDLIKIMYSIYDACMASYLKNYYTMELLNEKKKRKTDNENPFAS